MGEDFNRKAAELYAAQAADVDIIITTALIPGRPAPRLITEEMVASMKPGRSSSTWPPPTAATSPARSPTSWSSRDNGVRIIGYTDLPGRLPTQASQLFGTNLVNLLKLLTPGKDGQLVLDLDDVVQRGHDRGPRRRGPLAAAARPGVAPRRPRPRSPPTPAAEEPKRPQDPRRTGTPCMGVAAVAVRARSRLSRPRAFLGHFTVFMLAVVVGFYVIGNVHHALHTPLMSVTNAISGIIVVGALLQVGTRELAGRRCSRSSRSWWPASTSSAGSRVTGRMLQMFRKELMPR